MKSWLQACGLSLLTLIMAAPVAAQKEDVAETDSAIEFPEDVNDARALNKFFGEYFRGLISTVNSDPDAAEKRIEAMNAAIDKVEPKVTERAAKTMLTRARNTLGSFDRRIELARTTVESLKEKLAENPDDTKSISMLSSKWMSAISPLVYSDAEQAQKLANEAKEYFTALREKSEEKSTGNAISAAETSLKRLEPRIKNGLAILKLIGTKAIPIETEDWANGDALKEGDLKGKVVMLDFWAVWCGPCIATFPHLREWKEKYGDKGFEIIGVTRYYNYRWDEEQGRAIRVSKNDEEVPAADEQKMLEMFAKEHELTHRFAIQAGDSRELSNHYKVSGIPHAVLIDREGVVRMIRVGSGEKNAKDIGAMIEKLIEG